MAGTSREKNRSKKNTAAGKKNRSRNTASKNSEFYNEIFFVAGIAISLIFMLSSFGAVGKLGDIINTVTFGLVGFMAYILPFVLMFGVIILVANKGSLLAKKKMIYSLLLLCVIASVIQLFEYNKDITLLQYYKICSQGKKQGGLIGAAICKVLYPFIGFWGSIIVLSALVIILVILISEKLIVTGFARTVAKAFNNFKNLFISGDDYYEDDSYADDMSDKTPSQNRRKPAKTFKFENDNSKVSEESSDSKKPERTRKKKQKREEKRDIPNGMREINADAGNIPFEERNFPSLKEKKSEKKDVIDKDTGEIYQQELKNKFGKKEDVRPVIEKNKENKTCKIDSSKYQYPPVSLLSKPESDSRNTNTKNQYEVAKKLEETLISFGVKVTVTDISVGPTVTRYELSPEQGVKVSRITNLADDIKLNLAATDIRIEAPIPGKAAVGIEVPNKETSSVLLRELLESQEFVSNSAKLAFAVGKDLAGKPVVTDIAKMPHLLIAGQTGSGKSVCINTLIISILYKYHPDDVKLILVDPKVVELSVYNGIPHLLIPVVTDPKKASGALNWAVQEMVERYNKFAQVGVRDMEGYNKKIEKEKDSGQAEHVKMPQIVIVVDELADLMMVAPGEVEDAICRLAQMARAAGIHLIIATQRPSVNVITGLIKANVPSRIAFSVASAIDSRTILDGGGAEKLLGKGDMLFYPSGYPKPVRLQGAFVSDYEVNAVVDFLSANNKNTYSEEVITKIETAAPAGQVSDDGAAVGQTDKDQYFEQAGRFIIEKEKASIGMLQRVYRIGFNRAARIMDQLSEAGVVGPEEGTKPRKILMTMEEFEQYLNGDAKE